MSFETVDLVMFPVFTLASSANFAAAFSVLLTVVADLALAFLVASEAFAAFSADAATLLFALVVEA